MEQIVYTQTRIKEELQRTEMLQRAHRIGPDFDEEKSNGEFPHAVTPCGKEMAQIEPI